MLSILLVYIYIYPFVRRALNVLHASFSPIFQYFSAVNVVMAMGAIIEASVSEPRAPSCYGAPLGKKYLTGNSLYCALKRF